MISNMTKHDKIKFIKFQEKNNIIFSLTFCSVLNKTKSIGSWLCILKLCVHMVPIVSKMSQPRN